MFYYVFILIEFISTVHGEVYDLVSVKGKASKRSINVLIDGTIDLGPQWNYSYYLKDADRVLRSGRGRERTWVTRLEPAEPVQKHKVKDNDRTNDFAVHLFKQTMKVFDTIKRKITNPDMCKKVDILAKFYKDKFTEFVQKMRETNVKTSIGDQKAIFHTIDTSNLILQRLINFLKSDMEKIGVARVGDKNLQKHVDDERELEYRHVCTKYGYCRSSRGFTAMLQDLIKLLIQAPDAKLREATDAITVVVSSSDYTRIIDSRALKELRLKVKLLEKTELSDVRLLLNVLLGILSKSQFPIVLEGDNAKLVKKTVAFNELMNMMEAAMPYNEANRLEWDDIKSSLDEWVVNKRADILEIFEALNTNILAGIDKLDDDAIFKMRQQIKIIREYLLSFILTLNNCF